MKTFYYSSNNYIKLYNADCLEIMQRLVKFFAMNGNKLRNL